MRPKNTPNDPGRRERIVAAAIELLREGGVAAVTARATAARAGVPTGSVGYHVGPVPDLVAEAASRILADRIRLLEDRLSGATAADVVDRIADVMRHQLAEGRADTVLAYELSTLGVRDAAMRPVASSSILRLRHALGETLAPAEATNLAAAAEGFQLQCLTDGSTPTRAEIRLALRPPGATLDR